MENSKTFVQKWFDLRAGITKIKKKRRNDHFNSSYFDINDTLSSLNPLLEKNRLLLKQPIRGNKIYSIIQDIDPNKDGELEQEESYLELPADLAPQKMGSAITYFRRYTLVSLLGLEAEDDDGNAASGIGQQRKINPRATNGSAKKVPSSQNNTHKPQKAANNVKPQRQKKWLDLSNPTTGEVTPSYYELYNYKKQNPDLTKKQVLAQYKVNSRDMRYLNEIFN